MKLKKTIKEIILAVPLKNIFIGVKKLTNVFGPPGKRFYWNLRFRGDFTVPIDDERSFQMRSYGASLENSIFWAGITGEWEATSVSLWMKLAKDANVVFDVGANTGIYSLLAKAVNPNAKVYAFEPIDRIYKKLIYNNQINNYDTICLKLGVSDTDGTATFYDFQDENSYSSSLNSEFAKGDVDTVAPITIETIRLDTLIERDNIEQVDLIKIDVETYEPEVLEGMGIYLEKFSPPLLIEILNDDIARRVENLVSGKNYVYFCIDEKTGAIEKVEEIARGNSFNYLICNAQTAQRVGLQFDS